MRLVYFIGLTGGIGAGKSTVAGLLAERGAVVIDADRLAREVVEPGTDGLSAVAAAFGHDVLADDGSLDRKALAAKVFGDAAALATLNAIVHPRVAALTGQRLAELPANAIAVHDIPLLVEVGAADRYDLVVVVEAPVSVRVDRLVSARGMTADEALARVKSQVDAAERMSVADLVIDNDGSYEDLVVQVDRLWGAVRKLSEDAPTVDE